ncbi:histidine phosphatase superfamily [Xylaria sp. CBS 124048]|nr:histidine phosphatase superfamily [Xylaria sp. CBS 124048]
MTPTIHVIRHAEAAHNAYFENIMQDPLLSERGRDQCRKLASDFSELSGEVVCVLASPMRRTVETALAVFEPYTRSKKIVLLPEVHEHRRARNEEAPSQADLEAHFGQSCLDFSLIQPEGKSGNAAAPERTMIVRAQTIRLHIRAIAQSWRESDAHIVLVSHGPFIDHTIMCGSRTPYSHAEWRSYRFQDLDGHDLQAILIETPESLSRRGRSSPRPLPSPSPLTGQTCAEPMSILPRLDSIMGPSASENSGSVHHGGSDETV